MRMYAIIPFDISQPQFDCVPVLCISLLLDYHFESFKNVHAMSVSTSFVSQGSYMTAIIRVVKLLDVTLNLGGSK